MELSKDVDVDRAYFCYKRVSRNKVIVKPASTTSSSNTLVLANGKGEIVANLLGGAIGAGSEVHPTQKLFHIILADHKLYEIVLN